jgi:hypothetical protein
MSQFLFDELMADTPKDATNSDAGACGDVENAIEAAWVLAWLMPPFWLADKSSKRRKLEGSPIASLQPSALIVVRRVCECSALSHSSAQTVGTAFRAILLLLPLCVLPRALGDCTLPGCMIVTERDFTVAQFAPLAHVSHCQAHRSSEEFLLTFEQRVPLTLSEYSCYWCWDRDPSTCCGYSPFPEPYSNAGDAQARPHIYEVGYDAVACTSSYRATDDPNCLPTEANSCMLATRSCRFVAVCLCCSSPRSQDPSQCPFFPRDLPFTDCPYCTLCTDPSLPATCSPDTAWSSEYCRCLSSKRGAVVSAPEHGAQDDAIPRARSQCAAI